MSPSIGHHFPALIKGAPNPERIGAADGVTYGGQTFASQFITSPMAVTLDIEFAHDRTEPDDTLLIRPRSRRRHSHRRGLEAFGPRGEPRR